jgi:hypothetical protein
MTKLRGRFVWLPVILLPLWVTSVRAETLGTLALDGLSFLSFEDIETAAIPAGGTIRLRFGDPNPDGSFPVRIVPADVSIPPIPLTSHPFEVTYTLASEATGLLTGTGAQRRLEIDGVIRGSLVGEESHGSFEYSLRFTTEHAEATNLAGTGFVSVDGMRLVDGVWYLQLVAATVNKVNASPQPGKAVYTVLSGTIDHVPGE